MNPQEISNFIKLAFIEHDAFSIPQIGTFQRKSKSASIVKGVIYPPEEHIIITEGITEIDNFAEVLSKNLQIDTYKATLLAHEIGKNLKDYFLKKKTKLDIGNIGTLVYKTNNTFEFLSKKESTLLQPLKISQNQPENKNSVQNQPINWKFLGVVFFAVLFGSLLLFYKIL